MAIGRHVRGRDGLALAQNGQHALGLILGVLLTRVLVSGFEAGEERDGARCGEFHIAAIRCDRADRDGRGRDTSVGHLRGERALPDEVIEGELVGAQLALHLTRGAEGIARGTDGFVRLLRVLHLAVVAARGLGHVIVAVKLRGLGAGGGHRRLGERRGVRAHVGDVATLVEALGDAHRALRIPAEAPRGLLLERRGHEGGLGTALARLLDDGADGVVHPFERSGERSGPGLVEHHAVAAGELAAVVEVTPGGQALALDKVESGGEGSGIEGRCQVPVRRGDEGNALTLAVHDKSNRDRLHPACRASVATDLLPEHLGDGVAVEPIDDATRLLRIDELHVEFARLLEGIGDGVLGDLVEDHAAHGDLRLEHLEQVPGDGLALAVLVRGEEQLGSVLELLLQLRNRRLLIGMHDVEGGEAVVGVDGVLRPGLLAQTLGEFRCPAGEIAHVADRRLDPEIPGSPTVEVALDRLGLRRRLDDDEHTLHSHFRSCLLRRGTGGTVGSLRSPGVPLSNADPCRPVPPPTGVSTGTDVPLYGTPRRPEC